MENFYSYTEKIISKKAWELHKFFGIDFDDLYQQGFSLAMTYKKNFKNTGKAKFETYLFKCINFDLYRYAKKENERKYLEISIDSDNANSKQKQYCCINDNEIENITEKENFKNLLSEKSFFIVENILNNNPEMCDNEKYKNIMPSKYSIEKFLKKLGWRKREIMCCFEEISNIFNNNFCFK